MRELAIGWIVCRGLRRKQTFITRFEVWTMRDVNRFLTLILLLVNSVSTFANDALLGHWAIEVVTPGQPAASR